MLWERIKAFQLKSHNVPACPFSISEVRLPDRSRNARLVTAISADLRVLFVCSAKSAGMPLMVIGSLRAAAPDSRKAGALSGRTDSVLLTTISVGILDERDRLFVTATEMSRCC